MTSPDDRRYTAEHEWASSQDGVVTVGLTSYASDQLGDIVFVSLPLPGADVYPGQPMGEVESTKSVSDVYSPVSGSIVETNVGLDDHPELISEDPYGQGWLVKINSPDLLDGLMTSAEYKTLIDT